MNYAELAPVFADESKAIEFIEELIWPDGPVCPHCGNTEKIYEIKANKDAKVRPGLKKCGECRKQFTVKVGTIFEKSHIPMTKWLMAIYEMSNSKKGVSASQLQRKLGISYKAAWFMCHRIRHAMTKEPLAGKLGSGGGFVEVDETYIGGKAHRNRHKNKKTAGTKYPVMTLVDREGETRTFKIPNTKKGTLHTVIRPNVDGAAHIITDENPAYKGINKHYKGHSTVNHSKEYVRGLVFHTNFAESYHALLKRGIVGSYHHVSEKHLSRYLREFEFRWNNRKLEDCERFELAIKGASGKRLTYHLPL